jgi:hypothetical protein
MTLKMSGLGAEPKKMIGLGVLVVIAGYVYFSNRNPGGDSAPAGQPTTPVAVPVPLQKMPGRTNLRARNARGAGSFLEFHPSLKPKKDAADRVNIDPTLRLELLEKLQSVKAEAGNRSLFESLTAPAVALKTPEPPKVIIAKLIYGPKDPVAAAAAAKVPEPPPPAIPLKFYGFVSPKSVGVKRAFFLDGDDIIVATEGQLVKNRYKIVRIGINSAVVEDTQVKNNQQTLPLVEEQTG